MRSVTVANHVGCLIWDKDNPSNQLTLLRPMVLELPVVAMASLTRSITTYMHLGDRLMLIVSLEGRREIRCMRSNLGIHVLIFQSI